jgi:hypothetical protein
LNLEATVTNASGNIRTKMVSDEYFINYATRNNRSTNTIPSAILTLELDGSDSSS